MQGKQFYHSTPDISLPELVRDEYRQYQIYTLMERAIPYLQDGLKACQRRILYTLWLHKSKGLMKVSSATGLVLTVHPHGPQSIESTMVNLAQDFAFSNNYPLLDKKGYFGERMETGPAAGRYIECKLGKVAEILLFDDMKQVKMVPNYDEKVMEPVALLPKLPLMLLNGSEGIGTGFSSVIPSFDHKDIVESMVHCVQKGKAKKLTPWARFYNGKLTLDEKGKIITSMQFKQGADGRIFISELPRGYDAHRIYKHLNKLMDEDYLKDYIDSSVENDILIELIFKRGQTPTLAEVEEKVGMSTTLVPNYTLITDKGVSVFDTPEQIIQIFTKQRQAVVKRRYEIWAEEAEERLKQNEEIIRFIEEKQYKEAEKSNNRKSYIDYLKGKKFFFAEYLADMAIYRMTKEEVEKRQLAIKEDRKVLRDCKTISKSEDLVKEKLVEELHQVRDELTELFKQRDREREREREGGKKKRK